MQQIIGGGNDYIVQQPSPVHGATIAEATPGRVGRGELDEEEADREVDLSSRELLKTVQIEV